MYRWFTPLLHLDTHVKFVQYIKLAVQEAGPRPEMGARAAPAARGRRARSACSRIIRRRHRRRGPQAAADESARRCMRDPRHRFPHRRRADARGHRAAGPTSAAARWPSGCASFATRHDDFRSAVVNEPRGSDVMVGALLCAPADPALRRRRDLLQQRRLSRHVRPRHDRRRRDAGPPGPHRAGRHRIETPVGVGRYSLARRTTGLGRERAELSQGQSRAVDVPGFGTVTGDVAWGGNWFFLVEKAHGAWA